jgi:hypothetical protein
MRLIGCPQVLTERKSFRFDHCSNLEIIVNIWAGSYRKNGNDSGRTTRLARERVECKDRPRSHVNTEQRERMPSDLHATILYRLKQLGGSQREQCVASPCLIHIPDWHLSLRRRRARMVMIPRVKGNEAVRGGQTLPRSVTIVKRLAAGGVSM